MGSWTIKSGNVLDGATINNATINTPTVLGGTISNAAVSAGSINACKVNEATPVTAAASRLNMTGDVILASAGNALQIKEGANATMGRVQLVGGSANVSTNAVAAGSEIFVCRASAGGTTGFLGVTSRNAGSKFVINSSSTIDTSEVSWIIIQPAP